MNEMAQVSNVEVFILIMTSFILGAMFGAVIMQWWKEKDENALNTEKEFIISLKKLQLAGLINNVSTNIGKGAGGLIGSSGITRRSDGVHAHSFVPRPEPPKGGGKALNVNVKKKHVTEAIIKRLISELEMSKNSKKEARKYGLQDYVKPKRRKP